MQESIEGGTIGVASKPKKTNNKKLGILPASLIFDLAKARIKEFKAFGHTIKISPSRIAIFSKQPRCDWPGCHRRVSYFLAELAPNGFAYCQPYHHPTDPFEKHQLMNIDHTVARCLGGADVASNMTTMCVIHNKEKGKIEDYLRSKGVKFYSGKRDDIEVQ